MLSNWYLYQDYWHKSHSLWPACDHVSMYVHLLMSGCVLTSACCHSDILWSAHYLLTAWSVSAPNTHNNIHTQNPNLYVDIVWIQLRGPIFTRLSKMGEIKRLMTQQKSFFSAVYRMYWNLNPFKKYQLDCVLVACLLYGPECINTAQAAPGTCFGLWPLTNPHTQVSSYHVPAIGLQNFSDIFYVFLANFMVKFGDKTD